MKFNGSITAATAFVAAALLAPGAASAQSTWNMISGSGCTQQTLNAGNFGNTWGCTGMGTAGTAMTASAWSNDRGTAGTAQAGSGWANAFMSAQGSSGFGAASRTEGLGSVTPDHSVDSITPGTYDFVMVQFAAATILDQFRIGWGAIDSDVTVMRWAGAGLPTGGTGAVSTGSTATLDNTIGSTGWQLVGSYSDVCKNASNVLVSNGSCTAANSTVSTGATAASSYWLISAFNTTMHVGSTWTAGNDGFKLNWLQTKNATSVPEPSSLALLAAAGLGMFGARRARAAKA